MRGLMRPKVLSRASVGRRGGEWSEPRAAPRAARQRRPEGTAARRGGRPGQSLVEFSFLLAIILAPMMVGVVDFGRVFYYDVMVSAAAGEGARAAAGGGSNTAIIALVRESAPSGVIASDSDVTVTPSTCTGRAAANDPSNINSAKKEIWVTVTATSYFRPLTPLASWMVTGSPSTDQTLPLTRSVSQRMRTNCA